MWGLAASLLLAALLLVNHWRNQSNLYEQAKRDLSSCQSGVTKLKGINDALQASRDDTASKLNAYKLRHPNSCVVLSDTKQARPGPVGGNAQIVATTDALYDYAAVCRNYWVERQLLEKLVKETSPF